MPELTDIQKVRVLMGDKDANADGIGDLYGVTDDEINWQLDLNGTGWSGLLLSAARLLRSVATARANEAVSISVGNFSRSAGSMISSLESVADKLEELAYSQPAAASAELASWDGAALQVILNRAYRETTD